MNDLFSLNGRTALITGGNSGLGRAMALAVREAGGRVAVTGRDPERNREMARLLGDGDPDGGAVYALDVRDDGAVGEVVAAVAERFGAIDVLVNNAGLFRGGAITELTPEAWNDVLATHLSGAFYCARHVARVMIEHGRGGKIINIGSMYSVFGTPDFCDYGTAKTGVLGLTRSLAVELAPHRIQVNAILPGWFPTRMTGGLPDCPLGEEIRRKTPAGRWGRPEEIAGTAVYLASAASDFVTGVAIPVDGGYSICERFGE